MHVYFSILIYYTRNHFFNNNFKNKMNFPNFLILSCLIVSGLATLGPGDKKSKTKVKKENVPPPEDPKVMYTTTTTESIGDQVDISVVERNLVKIDKIPVTDLVNYHSFYCKPCAGNKSFESKVLGYVTPWNSKGYDVAKTFAKKLDYVSPVWLQVLN